MTTRILVNDYVTLNKGITPDEGMPIYQQIISAFEGGQEVILDFANVEMMTTAFLNVVIGTLYKNYTSEQLKAMLSFDNYTDATAVRIKKVTDNAKLFYKDQEKFNQSVEEVLHGTN